MLIQWQTLVCNMDGWMFPCRIEIRDFRTFEWDDVFSFVNS